MIDKMSKVTAKFQITIPPKVRKSLGIMPGMEVDISKKGNQYVLAANPVEDLKKKWRGKFRDKQTTDQYLDEVRGAV
jgi:AbrB family looped-hinge helix DNA binding protein